MVIDGYLYLKGDTIQMLPGVYLIDSKMYAFTSNSSLTSNYYGFIEYTYQGKAIK
jgi:hypothetical protein